jgi:hypothetical protein
MERIDEVSPRSRARITGAVYLVFFLTAIAGEVFTRQAGLSQVQPGGSGDAAALANNILAHESSLRLGLTLLLVSLALYIGVVALLYRLLRPVSRSLALMAAFVGVKELDIEASDSIFQLAPLVVLSGSYYLSVFSVEQLQALAMMFLNLNAQVAYLDFLFFGLFNLLIGYLIFRATFMPRILGALMMISGLAYMLPLAPPLADHVLGYVEGLGFVAEESLMLWLLVMGVNSQRWLESQARAAIELQPNTRGWSSK